MTQAGKGAVAGAALELDALVGCEPEGRVGVDAFYSTCAQLLPVLLIVLTLQLGSNGPSLAKLKGLLWLGGLAEVAALFGLVMSDVARPDL